MDAIFDMLAEIRPEHDFKASEDFIEEGLLDSFDIITLIDMLQEKYGITVDGLDIVPENFCSAEAIAELVRKNGKEI